MTDFTADSAMPVRHRHWALVKEGVVTELRAATHFMAHPFSKDEVGTDGVVRDVTGVECRVGYMADAKGNVTPSEGRDGPIADGLPAYHAGPGTVRLPVNVAAELAGNAPVVDESPKMPQSTATVVPQNTTVELHPEMPKHSMPADEADPAVAEEKSAEEGEKPAEKADEPTPSGFAAVDKKASDKK